MKAKVIQTSSINENRGKLTFGEFPSSLPFPPIRFFVVSGVPVGGTRGAHAHKTNHQFLFCILGRIKVRVYDGKEWVQFVLDSETGGLFIPALHWAEQTYETKGSQLLVLASEVYRESEYIRSMSEFQTLFQ